MEEKESVQERRKKEYAIGASLTTLHIESLVGMMKETSETSKL